MGILTYAYNTCLDLISSPLILLLKAEMMAKMQAQQAAFLAQYGDLDSEDDEEEGEKEGGAEKDRINEEEELESRDDVEIGGEGRSNTPEANSLGEGMTSPSTLSEERDVAGGIAPVAEAAVLIGTPSTSSSNRRHTSLPSAGPSVGGCQISPGGGGGPLSASRKKGPPLPGRLPSWSVHLGRVEACEGECAVCREGGGSGAAADGSGTSLGVLGWVAHVSVCPVLMTTASSSSSSVNAEAAGCHRGEQAGEAGGGQRAGGGGGGGGPSCSSWSAPGGTSSPLLPAGAMDEAPGLHVLCCGHKMHANCYARHR